MRNFAKAALAAVALAAAPSAAFAQAVVSGFNGSTLPNVDDDFVGPVNLGFTANYFGTSYTTTYVGTNGYLTFGAGQDNYTPVGLGAGYAGNPIIAAFYGDVDTRTGGQTTYGAGTFNGFQAFGVTYNNVGYYNTSAANPTTNRNTFQILLLNRADTGAGNFDILLNYNQILWETGTANGGSPATGRGGDSASVGYNAGTGNQAGTFFSFPGSQVDGALLDGGANSLVANSNIGFAGRYVFNVRNGQVTPPPGAIPEPATWAMMIGGFGLVGGAMRASRKRTPVAV